MGTVLPREAGVRVLGSGAARGARRLVLQVLPALPLHSNARAAGAPCTAPAL